MLGRRGFPRDRPVHAARAQMGDSRLTGIAAVIETKYPDICLLMSVLTTEERTLRFCLTWCLLWKERSLVNRGKYRSLGYSYLYGRS